MRVEAWRLACCINGFLAASSSAEPALKVVPNGPPMPQMPSIPKARAQDLPEKAGFEQIKHSPSHVEPAGDEDRMPSSPCQDVYQFHSEVRRSPVLMYASHLSTWLAESHYQASIATGALVTGILCFWWDGPRIWQVLVITGSSLGAAWLVHFEAELKNFPPSFFAEALLILATAASVAMAVHIGFEGSQVLVGTFIGFVSAAYCSDWARAADGSLPGIALLWYCAGGVFGMWVLLAWRRPLLSAISPLFGSFMAVSGLGSLLSRLSCPGLPQEGVWSSDAAVLLGPAGAQALAWHALCTLMAASAHRSGRPVLALVLLVAYAAFAALGALLAGIQCHSEGRRADGTPCPAFLAVPGQWRWQLSGCTAWVVLTLISGWRQLIARDSELSGGKLDSRARGIYMPVKEVSAEDGLAVDQPTDPLKTLLPPGSQAGNPCNLVLPSEAKPLTLSGYVHSIQTRRGST